MKKSFSIAIILLIWQSAWSQEIASNKSVIFENPLSREKIKIEDGNRVTIRYKILDARVTGIILHLTNSSLILGVNGEQSFISFRDIADIKLIKSLRLQKLFAGVYFTDPVTFERIKIREGNKVAVRLKISDVSTTAVVLGLSDSSMLLGTGQEQKLVSFRDINKIVVIPEQRQILCRTGDRIGVRLKTPKSTMGGTIVQLSDSAMTLAIDQNQVSIPFRDIASIGIVTRGKTYFVKLTSKNGIVVNGQLAHTTSDSVSLWADGTSQAVTFGASEIAVIRIRTRRLIPRYIGMGACVGSFLGLAIQVATFKPDCPQGPTYGPCNEFLEHIAAGPVGTFVGAVTGAAVGAIISIGAGANKRFGIAGNQSQFDLFTGQFHAAQQLITIPYNDHQNKTY